MTTCTYQPPHHDVPQLDDRDASERAVRLAAFDAVDDVRLGDYVRFSCGTLRRISYITPLDWNEGDDPVDSVQTSKGGSWYFGRGYCSFSGSLYNGVPRTSLTLTDEVLDGDVWMFRHDHRAAHNGVYFSIPFRVYECNREATR